MDIDMPEKDGLETSLEIFEFYKEKRDYASKPKIIVCTAFVGEDIQNACSRIGVSKFINKPVTLQLL
jgi:CheY-like chemotaxis protein